MARNGEMFDIPMLARSFDLEGMAFERPICIDDTVDLEYPESIKGRTLSHIAADHGFLNPRPHSGLADVMTLIGVMEKGEYDWDKMLQSAKSPIINVIAKVSFDERQLAKDAAFRWNPDEKLWTKRMRGARYEWEKFPFTTDIRKL